MKIKKLFVISLWYWRKRTKSYGNRSFSRTFQKMHRFLKKYIKTCHNNQQLKIKSVKANLQTRNFEARIKMRWKHWGKFDLWNIDLWILHIKISLYRIFMKIWEKKLTKFLRHFWLIEAKMKIKMKKYGKIIPIFEFFISKSDFIKNCKKKIDLFYTTFLTNREKNENNDEKMRKNESDFWIIHIKTKLCGNFHENPRKKFLTNLLKHFWAIEAKWRWRRKNLEKWNQFLNSPYEKLGYVAIFMKILGKKLWPVF